MIGSVHGCVSCPVVVRPWEPETLSHPQHPHPSSLHSQSQSQTYSFSQRSSSVHPLPQNIAPDDSKGGHSPPPQKDTGAEAHCENEHLTETDQSKSRSPGKGGPANGSPKKSGSAAESSKKMLSVFRSQQAILEQCQQLLGPKNIDTFDVDASSQKIVGVQSSIPDDGKSTQFGQRVHYVRSQVRGAEPDFSPQKTIEKESLAVQDEKGDFRKDSTVRSSLPAPPQLSESSGIESAPFHKANFSPTPLPSIQDQSKRSTTCTREEMPCDLPKVLLVGSLKPDKVLSSMSNPKLQPLKKALFLPPRPKLSLRKERKRQTKGPQKKKCAVSDDPASDSLLKKQLERKGEPAVPNCLPTLFDTTPKVLPPETSASDSADAVRQRCKNFSSLNFEKKADSCPQPFVQTTTSPSHPCREAPTPQSLDSSVWSLGQSAVATEVDALTTAAAAGDLKKVRSLLSEDVNVNAVNTFGRTAIQVMSVNNTDVAEVLLKAGANPNMQDKGRRAATSTLRTIAHDVADTGNTDMLRCLLRHGADVNLQDRWGNTPLHLAAKGGHLAAVRLLRRGTSLDLPNLQGKSPMMLLEEMDDSAIREWVKMKKSTVGRLQTQCVLALRQLLGPEGLQHWRKHAPDVNLQRQVLLQSQGTRSHHTSTSTIHSSQHSAGSRSLTAARGRSNSNGHPLLPGMSTGKQMTDFLSLRDLIPRRLSTGENTSLEVHNTSSGQSNDDVSLGAHATSSLASETGSLFETNLSSIEASHSADDLSLPSFDQSL